LNEQIAFAFILACVRLRTAAVSGRRRASRKILDTGAVVANYVLLGSL
jgi:hypothetical protein